MKTALTAVRGYLSNKKIYVALAVFLTVAISVYQHYIP